MVVEGVLVGASERRCRRSLGRHFGRRYGRGGRAVNERHCMYGTSSQVKVLLMYAFSQTSSMLLKACTLTSIAGLSPKLVYLTHRTTFAELNIIPI